MKIAIIVGKTPFGGVGTYVRELTKALEKHAGCEVGRFVYNTSYMNKSEIKKIDAIGWSLIGGIDNNDSAAEVLNKYDYVFALYHPCFKQVGEEEVLSYMDLLKNKVTTKKAIFFNEHNPNSIKRNYGIDYICDKDFLLSFNYIMQFETYTSSAKFIKSIIGEDEYNKRYVQLLLMHEFGSKDNWGKAEDKVKAVEYLGRFVNLKDPQRLIRAKDRLDESNYIIELRGLTRQISLIGIPDLCYKFVDGKATKEPSEKVFWVKKKWFEENGYTEQGQALMYPYEKRNKMIFSFGEYDNTKVYDTVKNAAYACDFFNLKHPEDYGKQSLEYCMYEFVENGIIMLLDSSVGENCYLMEDAKLTDKQFNKYNTALYLNKDLSNLNEIVEKMDYLYNNPKEYDKFRNDAYDFWKKHTDPESIVKKLVSDISSK